jgi:hypothetical protein
MTLRQLHDPLTQRLVPNRPRLVPQCAPAHLDEAHAAPLQLPQTTIHQTNSRFAGATSTQIRLIPQ